MIASLPMYDWPETRAANDRFWIIIRDNLRRGDHPAPESLCRMGDPWEHWQDPTLFLSQTCGLPYRARLHGKVTLVGTPVHDLPCEPGHYFSVIVARALDERREFADFAGARLAVNDGMSQSGWAAADAMARASEIEFSNIIPSGAHRASALAVAGGKADLAALDAVTWKLVQKFDDSAMSLRVVATTLPTPALPYITALDRSPVEIFAAIQDAIEHLDPADRALLCLKGVTTIPVNRYLELQTPDTPF
ncbi:MAG: PhnD/SsuA/transferrin family substrate-binding protein [Silicimonas sp.]|nr:PhnD/SsuA/transferrin family substrate-binding protein [Silicimonas sp.]